MCSVIFSFLGIALFAIPIGTLFEAFSEVLADEQDDDEEEVEKEEKEEGGDSAAGDEESKEEGGRA